MSLDKQEQDGNLEQLKNEIAKLKESKEYWESEAKKSFTDRDEAKRKAKELEDAEIAKRGEYQKLAEQYKTELETVKKDLSEVSAYKEKYLSVEQERRTELISRLPDGKPKEVAEKITDISLLKDYVDTFIESIPKKAGVDNNKGSYDSKDIKTAGKKWTDFTLTELSELKKHQPAEYDRLYKEHTQKRKRF